MPADLEEVILQCLRKDPRDRPSSARDLREALSRCRVRPWTTADAVEWWAKFRPRIADQEEHGGVEHPFTIDVDAANRMTRTAVPST